MHSHRQRELWSDVFIHGIYKRQQPVNGGHHDLSCFCCVSKISTISVKCNYILFVIILSVFKFGVKMCSLILVLFVFGQDLESVTLSLNYEWKRLKSKVWTAALHRLRFWWHTGTRISTVSVKSDYRQQLNTLKLKCYFYKCLFYFENAC